MAKVLSSSEDPYVSALTIDKINAANGVYPLEGIEEPRREFMDRVFATPSTRMDVYYDVQNVTNDGYVERGSELMCGPVIPFSDTLVEIKKA